MAKKSTRVGLNLAPDGASPRLRSDRYSPCLTLLRGLYPRLTGAEQLVADYVLGNPSLVLRSSITAVARASAVGTATVARLSSKLGYDGFPEMKIGLALELLSPYPDNDTPEPVREDDDTPTVIQKVFKFGAQSLYDTATLLDPEELDRAARAIIDARRVEIYAAGGLTSGVAQIAHRRLLTLGIPCGLVTRESDQVLSATLLNETDVAIGLSNSGEANTVAEALNTASEIGATTICITSVPQSPVTQVARIVLMTAFRESWFQGDAAASRIAMVGLVDTVYACVLLHKWRCRDKRAATSDGVASGLDV